MTKIVPFNDNDYKRLSKTTKAFFGHNSGDLDIITIGLGSSEEDTISSLWHETMHEVILTMFDDMVTGNMINELLDEKHIQFKEFWVGSKKIFELDLDKSYESVMHRLHYFLFGLPKTPYNYRAEKIRKSWGKPTDFPKSKPLLLKMLEK